MKPPKPVIAQVARDNLGFESLRPGQKDQVDSIADQNSAEAVAVNSSARVSEIRQRLARVSQGKIEDIFANGATIFVPTTSGSGM